MLTGHYLQRKGLGKKFKISKLYLIHFYIYIYINQNIFHIYFLLALQDLQKETCLSLTSIYCNCQHGAHEMLEQEITA